VISQEKASVMMNKSDSLEMRLISKGEKALLTKTPLKSLSTS